MTTILFWVGFIGLFFAILNLLPVAGTLSPAFASGLTLIVSNMKAWNGLFPISELLTAVGIMASFYLAKYGWKGFKWVISVVRGGGAGA